MGKMSKMKSTQLRRTTVKYKMLPSLVAVFRVSSADETGEMRLIF